jgi:hypothetical protein
MPLEIDINDESVVKGPFTNVNSKPNSHWNGKETQIVYDASGRPLCMIPRIYHYDRAGKTARALATAIAKALTDAGFEFNELPPGDVGV